MKLEVIIMVKGGYNKAKKKNHGKGDFNGSSTPLKSALAPDCDKYNDKVSRKDQSATLTTRLDNIK
jgi:hypothetical protein